MICFALLTLAFASCQQNDVYSHYQELKGGKWQQNEVLAFDVDSNLIEVGVPYNITIDVNHNVDYPYRNIWLYIDHTLDTDTAYSNVKREYELADAGGDWLGGGFAFIYRQAVPLFENYTFTEKRNYRFEIRHAMRDQPLAGMEKIGLRISTIPKEK